MSRELEFDGWWEGKAIYSCDCCQNSESFRFDSEEIDSKAHRAELRKRGWVTAKVNGQWKDFCVDRCRDKYIRNNTI